MLPSNASSEVISEIWTWSGTLSADVSCGLFTYDVHVPVLRSIYLKNSSSYEGKALPVLEKYMNN
jgi:hypothetical protein